MGGRVETQWDERDERQWRSEQIKKPADLSPFVKFSEPPREVRDIMHEIWHLHLTVKNNLKRWRKQNNNEGKKKTKPKLLSFKVNMCKEAGS